MAGRTFISQPNQIFASELFDDARTVSPSMTGSVTLEEDLNNIRTQLRQVLWANVSGSWYDAVTAPSGGLSARGLNTINTDLTDLEQKRLLFRRSNLNNVMIGSGSNFALLSVSLGTAPANYAAIGDVLTTGSVVAEIVSSSGGETYGAHSLAQVSSSIGTGLRPRNLCIVRDYWTEEPILDDVQGNEEIHGLLQIEEGATDGGAFDDVSGSHRSQISFVIELTSGVLATASISAIGGKHVLYSYVCRKGLDEIPEDAFLADTIFVDAQPVVSGATLADITRQRAYDNQSTTPVELTNNADLDLAASVEWSIRDAADADLLTLIEDSAGSATTMSVGAAVDLYQNDAQDVDFTQGISVDEGGTQIDLGITAGTIQTLSGNNLILSGGAELLFGDIFADTSNYGGPLALSTGSGDWDCFYDMYGPNESLLHVLCELTTSLSQALSRRIWRAGTTPSVIGANVNVTYPTNLDAALGDYTDVVFTRDLNLYLNGVLLFPGVSSGDPNDVYPGTTPANGDLRFPYNLRSGSILQMEKFAGTAPLS